MKSCSRFSLLLFILSLLLLIFLVFTVGCSSSSTAATTLSATSTPSASTTTSTSSQYSIAVIFNDKQIATLTVADLAKLPQVKSNIAGTDENGPTFLSVLNSIGIQDFTEVTVSGFTKGRVATADLTLKKSDITDNVMLALVSRGTAKLTGTDIGANQAIIDVNKIVIK